MVRKQSIAWARGEEVDKTTLAQDVGFMRRKLSQIIVAAFGKRLSSRMCQVGMKGESASKRRQEWTREEARARMEREGAWLEKIQGRSIIARGRFWRGGRNELKNN